MSVMTREKLPKWIWAASAALLVAGAALFQGPIDQVTGAHEQLARRRQIAREHPEYIILTIAPGGLRAPLVGYLWIRAEDLKQQGRFYDAKQSADLICSLQPRFAGAWGFNAWNMAYNISVATHTPEERWNWVSNGFKLLRDKGISYNPKALNLYKELSWIFFHKIGGSTDDMHRYYKRRLAGEMQRLLAPPAYGTTEEVIAAFRPIAEAPLDKAAPARQLPLPWAALVCSTLAGVAGLAILAIPRLHGTAGFAAAAVLLVSGAAIFGLSLYASAGTLQPGARPARAIDRLLDDPQVARYVQLLAEQDVDLGWSLLEAYNRLSMDARLQVVRAASPKVETPRQQALFDLINTGEARFQAARDKVLAFVRAKILWNEYKMDPQWMLRLMAEYGPLDWRLAQAHSLYWATYGLHVCKGTPLDSLENIDTLNTARHLLNSMKDLTWGGRLMYEENPNEPRAPFVEAFFDPRYVQRMRRLYDTFRLRAQAERPKSDPKDNVFRSGHVNYLINVMQMLYAMHEREMAQQIYDYIKDTYRMDTDEWVLPLRHFLLDRQEVDGKPVRRYAMSLIGAALRAGYVFRVRGNTKAYRDSLQYAEEIWRMSRDKAERLRLPSFEDMQIEELGNLIIRPKVVGYALSLEQRSRLYRDLHVTVRMRRVLYDAIKVYLARRCDAKGIDFDKAFPEPTGMKEFRARRRAVLDPTGRL